MGYWLGWLLVFVVGSLIVSFLISPETFASFTENIKSIANKVIQSPNTIELIPSQMPEYKLGVGTCSYLEYISPQRGDMKQMVCQDACGKRSLEYSSKECNKNILVCYCKGE